MSRPCDVSSVPAVTWTINFKDRNLSYLCFLKVSCSDVSILIWYFYYISGFNVIKVGLTDLEVTMFY